jgi:hypothetical protein
MKYASICPRVRFASKSSCARREFGSVRGVATSAGSNTLPPATRVFSHSPERCVYASCCAAVARWLCGASGKGTASFGARIWLSAAQIPTGGVAVSMNPMETSEGTSMRAAQFTVSK